MTTAQYNSDNTVPGSTAAGSIPLSPADSAAGANGQSLGGLVRDATTHVSTLVRAEVELAKSEVTAEVKKGLKGSIFFIVALTVLLFSSFFFFFALAETIAYFGLPRPAAFGIVFAFMLIIAGLAGFLGYRKVRKLHAPQRTISTVKDTATALRHRGEQPAQLTD
ncbi:MAG: phage holin family protein [Sciscionella sp.]